MREGTDEDSRLMCIFCDSPARFFSQSGLLCSDDALVDAIRNGWMPARIERRDAWPHGGAARTWDRFGETWPGSQRLEAD